MSLIFGNRTININLFDTELTINTLRENGYYRASRMCQKSSLLRDEVSILMNLLMLINEGDEFIDIGANIGIFSSILSRYQNLVKSFNT